MITFICCSINPDLAQQMVKNISDSVGIPHEFIIFDNREAKLGICKVYNNSAEQAKYNLLCFLHEDILFHTQNWGERIASQLQTEGCGVIGFAGSIVKHTIHSGWMYCHECKRQHLIQNRKKGKLKKVVDINPNNETFARVVTLDGLCLFVRKDVWHKHRFDEKNLPNFHGYDVDFALNVSQNYKNFVCYNVDVEHLSTGSLNKNWVEAVRVIHLKWGEKLPMYTPEWHENFALYNTPRTEYQSIRYTIKNLHELENPRELIINFFKKYWYKSHLSWLLLLKLTSKKEKK